jgi:hypothetical protein
MVLSFFIFYFIRGAVGIAINGPHCLVAPRKNIAI